MDAFLNLHPQIQQQYNEFVKENNPQKKLSFMTPVQTFNEYNKMNITTFLQPDYDPTKMDVDEPEIIKPNSCCCYCCGSSSYKNTSSLKL